MKQIYLPMIVALSLAAATHAAQDPKLVVMIDGKPVEFANAQPQTMRGRVMVPMRAIFEALGALVEYDDVSHKVVARKQNEDVELTIGNRIARRNGAEIMLDTKPTVLSGTTMVPLRFIAESLGAKVNFDKANSRVMIETKSDTPTSPPN